MVMACGGGGRPSPEIEEEDSLCFTVGILDDDSPEDTDEVAVMEKLIERTPMPVAAEGLFDDFFFNFIANKTLQRQRITFPLTVLGIEEIDTITDSEWVHDSFFLRQGYYTLIFNSNEEMDLVRDTSVCNARVERISLTEEVVSQYIFRRDDGLWRMNCINVIPLAQDDNGEFLAFFRKFATDPTFAMLSLADVVEFEAPDPDDDFSVMEGVITRDTWPAFAPDLPHEEIYNVHYLRNATSIYNDSTALQLSGDDGRSLPDCQPGEDLTSTMKIFVIRGISNGFETELTFRHANGRWLLTRMTM